MPHKVVGLAKNGSRNDVIFDRVLQPAKPASGEGHAPGQRLGGQFDAAGHVAERENAGFGRAIFLVHLNAAVVIDLHIRAFQTQSFQVGSASGGANQRIDFDRGAISKRYLQTAESCGYGLHIDAEPQVYSGLGDFFRSVGANVGVEATQKQGPTIQLCGALVRQRTDQAIASVYIRCTTQKGALSNLRLTGNFCLWIPRLNRKSSEIV